MLKPRGLVPWGLPGPTRGRRDAAALASKTKGTVGWGEGLGWGPADCHTSPFLCLSGLGHRNGPLVGGLISNILFFMYGDVDASVRLVFIIIHIYIGHQGEFPASG